MRRVLLGAGGGAGGGSKGLERLFWPAPCLVVGIRWDEQVHCGSAQSICDLGDPERGGRGARREVTRGPELRSRCQGAESAVRAGPSAGKPSTAPDQGPPRRSLAPARPGDAFWGGAPG